MAAAAAAAAAVVVAAGDAKRGAWRFSGRALPLVNRTVSRKTLSLGWTWPRCASWTTFFERYEVAPSSHSRGASTSASRPPCSATGRFGALAVDRSHVWHLAQDAEEQDRSLLDAYDAAARNGGGHAVGTKIDGADRS